MNLSGQDRDLAFVAQVIDQAEGRVDPGDIDTLALGGGTFVEIDAVGAAGPVTVKIAYVQGSEFSQLDLTAITPAISIEIEPASGSAFSPGPETAASKTNPVTLTIRQAGVVTGMQANGVVNFGTVSDPQFGYVTANPEIFSVPNTGHAQSTIAYSLSPGVFSVTAARIMGTNIQCRQGENRLEAYPTGSSPSGTGTALIFIHGWQPRGQSCGYFQIYQPEKDFEKLRNDVRITDLLNDERVTDKYQRYILRYTTFNSVSAAAEFLSNSLMNLPFQDVVIVAHSMGGVVAREYMRQHGSSRVRALVTLGSPHAGTEIADAMVGSDPAGCIAFFTACLFSPFFVSNGVRDLSTKSLLIANLQGATSDSAKIYALAGNLRPFDVPSLAQYRHFSLNLPAPNDGLVSSGSALPNWVKRRSIHDGYDHSEMQRGDQDRGLDPDPLIEEVVCILGQTADPGGPARLFSASVQVNLLGSGPPSDLYRVEPSSCGTDSRIGRIRTANGMEPAVFDVAWSPGGSLWGISPDGGLYAIDTLTALARIGPKIVLPLGEIVNALTYDLDGRLLGATTPGGIVLAIDTLDGTTSTLGSFGGGKGAWGDLAVAPNGELYGTTLEPFGLARLVKIDPNTFRATAIGTGSLGAFGNVWGLAFVGNRLLGLTGQVFGTGSLVQIDILQGIETKIRDLAFNAGGASALKAPQ